MIGMTDTAERASHGSSHGVPQTSEDTMNGKRNWTYLLVAVIVRAFMLGAAAISFSHIVATSHALGLGWEAWTVPGFVDGLAVLGLVGRSPRFADSTQRAGLRLMAGAGALSLACNVYAGHNLGQQLYGVLVVAGFIAAEWYAMKLRPAPQAEMQERTGKRCEPGCTCRKHAKAKTLTPAQKRAITIANKKAAAELTAMANGYSPADAPVSPAVR